MRSRWFHLPTFHAPEDHGGKKVSWLELFYDLIFVASIIQLGDHLSHDVSPGGFGLFALHFAPLWIAWTGFTFYANRFTVDDFLHRTLVLAKMFAVGTMAIASHHAVRGDPRGFALAFAVAQGLIGALYWRAWRQAGEGREYAAYWGSVFGIGGACFAVSALLPTPWCYGLWFVGMGAVFSAPFSRHSRALQGRFPLDFEHLSERYGLLTIIVLGESFVKVLSFLSAPDQAASAGYVLKGFFNLTLTCCIWWIYFDDVAGSHLKRGRGSLMVWLWGHLPLALAITAVGVAVKKAIKFDLALTAPAGERWLLAGALALTILSVAMIDSVTERRNVQLTDRNRINFRVASAALVLLLGQIGGAMNAGVFLGLVAALLVALVLFDMMMAPLEESEEPHQAVAPSELYRRRLAGEAPTTPARLDVARAVRKGGEQGSRRDLYFFFLEGTWTRVLASFGFIYLFLNVFFACLYLLDPASIDGGEGDFGHAFFFSVQTLSTIGYGAMSPANSYGDMVVTLEAAAGMLFVALATGLMFAKASRPQSSVRFSKGAVITTRDGSPTLQLRAANARGNEVVDGRVSVSALMDEVTAEGHHMRRVRTLALERSHTPMFSLSWSILHPITPDSPLYGCDFAAARSPLLGLIVTFQGHDGTYGQTTYARKTYQPDDIQPGRRFVDVISQLPDGRLMLDLDVFHDTAPDTPPPGPATTGPATPPEE